MLAVAVVVSLFLSEVPLRGRERRRAAAVETEGREEADTAPVAAFGD